MEQWRQQDKYKRVHLEDLNIQAAKKVCGILKVKRKEEHNTLIESKYYMDAKFNEYEKQLENFKQKVKN